MATRTPTRRRASGRRRESSKKTKKPAKAKSAPKRPASSAKRDLHWRVRLWSAARSRVDRLSSEVWGGILLLLSLFSTLFLVGAGGEVGEVVKGVYLYVLGRWAPLGPLALLGMGLVLVLGKPELTKRRLFLGVLLFFVSTLGLFHLLTGALPLASGIEAIQDRGGAVGALIAFPLQRAMGTGASVAVFVLGITASVLVLTRTSLKEFLLAWVDLVRLTRSASRGRATSAASQDDASYRGKAKVPGVPAPPNRRRKRPRRWRNKPRDRGPWPIARVIQVPESATRPQVTREVVEEFPIEMEFPPVKPDSGAGAGDEVRTLEMESLNPVRPPLKLVEVPPSTASDKASENGRAAGKKPPASSAAAQSKPDGRARSAPPTPYRRPPLELLSRGPGLTGDREDLQGTAGALQQALADHGVDARITGAVSGPSVTRFEIKLAPGVKVQKLSALSNDIAYALATPDVRLLVPIPGRSAIGVEVPNAKRQLVKLGDILASRQAVADSNPLVVGLGMDIGGRPYLLNLAELPHLLIAGATGAGKSSSINSIITSLLLRTRPEDLKMILVDPKRVELGQYEGVPHLLTRVITDPKKAAEALKWVVAEMDRRYDLLAEAGVRDIGGYAAKWEGGALDGEKFDRFPFLVVVVDELNDLMMVSGREVEMSIVRIAQMARAVGIHLVLATQRPSVNVITGVIKANVPSRLAFSVASQTDSRVIIDSVGAEKLVGRGDMLVVTARQPRPHRVQGAWVEESEIAEVVAWISGQDQPEEGLHLSLDQALAAQTARPEPEDDEDEDLVRRAMELVVRSQLGSTSMLQRKLRVGFARAGRLMDILERRGVVGPSQGLKAREVLITPEELGTP